MTFYSNASFCFVSSVVFTREAQGVEHFSQRVLSRLLGEGAEIARRDLSVMGCMSTCVLERIDGRMFVFFFQ